MLQRPFVEAAADIVSLFAAGEPPASLGAQKATLLPVLARLKGALMAEYEDVRRAVTDQSQASRLSSGGRRGTSARLPAGPFRLDPEQLLEAMTGNK